MEQFSQRAEKAIKKYCFLVSARFHSLTLDLQQPFLLDLEEQVESLREKETVLQLILSYAIKGFINDNKQFELHLEVN